MHTNKVMLISVLLLLCVSNKVSYKAKVLGNMYFIYDQISSSRDIFFRTTQILLQIFQVWKKKKFSAVR